MEESAYKTMSENERIHWWFCGRRAILMSILSKLSKKKFQRALDIGCGTGGSMQDLNNFANEFFGIEPSLQAIEFAHQNYPGLNIVRGTYPNELPLGKYNLITMLDVLEHIEDDQSAVDALPGLLSPDGIAIITIPAFNSLWSTHDDHLHHFRRYSIDEVKKLFCKNSNLKIEEIHYYNSLLFIPIAVNRLFRKLFKLKSGGDDEKIPNRFINKFLQLIFSLERFWLPKWSLPFGVSIICIVKNK